MVNMLDREIRVNDSFSVSKVVSSTQDKKKDKEPGKLPKKFGDVESQALSGEGDSQTQKQLGEQLGVGQQTVSNRLQEMEKIQKTRRWVPHESNGWKMEKRKIMLHFAHSVQKEVVFGS